MDQKTLVEEIRTVLTNFMEDEFKVNIAMLLKDSVHDTYTFLLSSPLLDLLTPYSATKLIAEYFHKNLSEDAFSIISKINVVHTEDPNIPGILEAVKVDNSIVNLGECTFFNVYVEDAILLESHKE